MTTDFEKSFPWPAGTNFDIDGPLFYNGEGKVDERTKSKLKLRWQQNIPADKDPGPTKDGKINLTIELENKGAGKAKVKITNNDGGATLAADDNARIEQDNGSTKVEYKDKTGASHTIEFQPENDIRIGVGLDGIDHDLNKK